MYENASVELKRILALVEECPEPLRASAFAILLQGYVDTLGPARPAHVPPAIPLQVPTPAPSDHWRQGIPEEVVPRFETMAARLKIQLERFADLFDFATDPFTYAAIHVEGKSAKQRMLRVTLLVAARSYIATGRWAADWAEIKAMCTHQNCYDMNNFAANLRAAEGDLFKKVTAGTSVELASKGQKEAERLLAQLAGGGDASEQ